MAIKHPHSVLAVGLTACLLALAAIPAHAAEPNAEIPRDTNLAGEAANLSTEDLAAFQQLEQVAQLQSNADNFAGAEAAYRNLLVFANAAFGPESVAVGVAQMELALQISNQGRFDEAGDLFLEATPIVNNAVGISLRARLSSYRALDAANRRQYAEGLEFARNATALRRTEAEQANAALAEVAIGGAVPSTVSNGEIAHSLRIEAEMALRGDDLPAAQAAATEAMRIIAQEPQLPVRWRPDILSLQAEIDERRGRVVSAERNYLDALALNEKLFGDTVPTIRARMRMGEFYSDQQSFPAALTSYRTALAELSEDAVARSQIVPDQIVPFIAAAEASARDAAQRAMLDAEIYRASQLVNSSVADQTIARVATRLASGNAELVELIGQIEETQQQRDAARIDLATEYAKRDEQRSAEHEAALGETIERTAAQAEELLHALRQNFPDYAQRTAPGPAELTDIQAQLRPGDALLSFVTGVRASYALLVTQDGLTTQRLDATSESLSEDITDLRSAFVPQLGILPDFSLVASSNLYQRLLAPLEASLAGVDHLIVAPNGDLASLPFALLVSSMPDGATTYSDAAWLNRRFALSQVPSPRAFLFLQQLQRTRTAAPQPFFGIGDPLFTGPVASEGVAGGDALGALTRACREDGAFPPALLRALAPLPETAEELRMVAQALGADADSFLMQGDANEANFRARMLDQYRVLYFATHGLLPGELHCQAEPGLVLSPPANPSNSTNTDGLLDASEIASFTLNADLVVLSACNTAAQGERLGGGALAGLADAFFGAGARSVLASHWEVPSQETMRLMTGLFQRASSGPNNDLAQALQQSQLSLIADPATAHPFYWAAFTLMGASATLTNMAGIPITDHNL
jgi:CHAT domain-containing protein